MGPNPWANPRPFLLGPDDADTAFVLLHGFTGAPSEMRQVGELLAERGYRCYGPQLPGHGGAPEDLEGVRAEDWIAAAQSAVAWARESHPRRLIIAGLSMGGLLTTVLLGERHVEADAAILFAPAFEIANPLFGLAGIGRFVLRAMPAPNLPRGGLASADGWKRLWHYDERPVEAVWQLRRLQKRAWKVVGDIDVPTLIIQGRKDLTLKIDGAAKAATRLGDRAELVWLPESGHCLTVDLELDIVMEKIEGLLAALEG